MLTTILKLSALLICAPLYATSAVPSTLEDVDAHFAAFDLNGDGIPEIRWVRELGLAPGGGGGRLVLVIVEPRLLPGIGPMSPPSDTPLLAALRRYAEDLRREGFRVRGLAMQVYDGPVHQDGRTVLAMREYLRAVQRVAPDLAGAVIVGSFPEAMLVRQYNWRQRCPTILDWGIGVTQDFGGREVCRLRTRAEMVAGRCELILCDLDGKWERLYHAGPVDRPWLMAVYPDATPPEGASPESEWSLEGPTVWWESGTDRYEDFFLVDDGRYQVRELPQGGIELTLRDDLRDDECSEADKQRANPMARPDILVSRINARHIALRPKSSVRGVRGEGLLDESGRPQTVTFASESDAPRGLSVWEQDPALEQHLLVEYFDRNHRYRTGAFGAHLKPASAAYGLGSFMGVLRGAREEWKDFADPAYDLTGEGATLDAVVEWLKRPAVVRGIAAHSDPWGAHFAPAPDAATLERVCGGQPWSWIREGNRLVPTLGAASKLDYPVLRTLWQNGVLADTACLFLHSGCEAIMPGGCMSVPYNHPDYAYWQGAETLLFYARGLALVGRAKVFYDFPRDFAQQLGAGKTFGEAWAHYFELESAEPNLENVGGGIGRKRAYFWSVLGDWTVTLLHGAGTKVAGNEPPPYRSGE